ALRAKTRSWPARSPPGKPCGCSPVTASDGQHPGAACTTTAPWPSCRVDRLAPRAQHPRERYLMDGNVSAGRGDDEVAVCSDATHLLKQIQWGAAGAASASRHTRTVPSSAPLTMTGVLSGSSPTATA